MAANLEEKKKKIEIQKKKIHLKEKIIKEQEKQKKFKRLSEIIGIAIKANIDQYDEKILLGAFLEIANKMHNEETIREWRKMGELYLQEQDEKSEVAIAISFKADPGMAVKEELKKMRFRWNPFRKEYCGYANQREIEDLLKETNSTLELIP